MKKQLILFTALLFSVAAFAQNNQKPGKRINVLNMDAGTGNEVVFTIAATGDVINVTARRSWAKIKANNPLRGKIIFSPGDVAENFGSTASVGVASVKVVLGKDPGGQPVKSTTLGADGSFEFTDIPAGTYKVMLGSKLIAKGLKMGGE